MALEKKLITCKVNETSEIFNIYGTIYDKDKESFDFDCSRLTLLKNGKEIPYTISNENWNGTKCTPKDFLYDIIHSQILQNDRYDISFMDENLQEYIDSFYIEKNLIKVDNKDFLKEIPYHDTTNLYQLCLATNNYLYYGHEDMFLMVNAHSHQILSDNYFAEDSFWNSIDNIENGTEQVLWDILPDDVLSVHHNNCQDRKKDIEIEH